MFLQHNNSKADGNERHHDQSHGDDRKEDEVRWGLSAIRIATVHLELLNSSFPYSASLLFSFRLLPLEMSDYFTYHCRFSDKFQK